MVVPSKSHLIHRLRRWLLTITTGNTGGEVMARGAKRRIRIAGDGTSRFRRFRPLRGELLDQRLLLAVEVFTNLLTENWGVYKNTGTETVPVIGTPITDLVEITVASAAHSSVANANIGSIPGTSTSSGGPTKGAAGLNSGQAAQGLAPPLLLLTT